MIERCRYCDSPLPEFDCVHTCVEMQRALNPHYVDLAPLIQEAKDRVNVEVDEYIRDRLIAMGWTPPVAAQDATIPVVMDDIAHHALEVWNECPDDMPAVECMSLAIQSVWPASGEPYYKTHEPPHCPSCDCGDVS